MQTTGLVRRVLGDVIGCITLAVLVGLVEYVWPGETTLSKFKELFPPIYLLLAILGYATWIEKERKMPNDSWLKGALLFFGAGIVSLAGDTLIGHFINPSAPLIEAPLSAGIPFIVTLFLGGLILVAIAGWTRGLIIRHRRNHS
jgi:hypothetical protein